MNRILTLVICLVATPGALQAKNVIKLLPQNCEEALALSALPEELREDASIYVLFEDGYRKTRKVDGQFNCLVTRNHPTSIVPICFDQAGSDAILESSLRRGEMSQQGFTDAEFRADRQTRTETGEVKPANPGISYMVSDFNYIYFNHLDRLAKVGAHTMYYAPYVTNEDIGGSPTLAAQKRGLVFMNDPGVHGMMVAMVDQPSDSRDVLKQCDGLLPAEPSDWLQ